MGCCSGPVRRCARVSKKITTVSIGDITTNSVIVLILTTSRTALSSRWTGTEVNTPNMQFRFSLHVACDRSVVIGYSDPI